MHKLIGILRDRASEELQEDRFWVLIPTLINIEGETQIQTKVVGFSDPEELIQILLGDRNTPILFIAGEGLFFMYRGTEELLGALGMEYCEQVEDEKSVKC